MGLVGCTFVREAKDVALLLQPLCHADDLAQHAL